MAQANAWFSSFSRSNGLCVLPIVVLALAAVDGRQQPTQLYG